MLVSVAVAIATAAAIYQPNQIAEYGNNIRLLLTQAKEQVSRLNALEWESISKGKIDDNLTKELAENQKNTEIILDKPRQIDRQNYDLKKFFDFYARYKIEIDSALELVAQGKIKEARAIDSNSIDEIYDDL